MKLPCSLLALGALQGTSAFFIQSPRERSVGTALTMSARSSNQSIPGFVDTDSAYGFPGRPAPSTNTATSNNGRRTSLPSVNVAELSARPNPWNPPMAPPSNRNAPLAPRTNQKANRAQVRLDGGDIWESDAPIKVQGGSLRTWAFETVAVERLQVLMKTDGRPMNADIELWHGPDNTPQKMRVYNEEGNLRPFSAIIETPRGHNSLAIRNTGHLEFPLNAIVEPDMDGSVGDTSRIFTQEGPSKIVQGGAVFTKPFDHSVASVQVALKTDGRPLNARIELLQGPNNNKQVIEIYTEHGQERPFFAIIATPGSGNVIRIVNTATIEFPLSAAVEPFEINTSERDVFNGGGWDNPNAFLVDRLW